MKGWWPTTMRNSPGGRASSLASVRRICARVILPCDQSVSGAQVRTVLRQITAISSSWKTGSVSGAT